MDELAAATALSKAGLPLDPAIADAMLSNTTAEWEAIADAMAPVNGVNGH